MSAEKVTFLYDACPRCRRFWTLKGELCRRCELTDRRESPPLKKVA